MNRTYLKSAIFSIVSKRMMEFILFCLCVFLAIRAPGFLSLQNMLTILRSVSMQGLIAFGMTMVIIVGEIDLSVGANVAFTGCLIAWLTQRHCPIPIGIVVTAVLGGLTGVFTGIMRTRFAVPTFITTLALFTGLKGGALMLTGGFPITPFPEWYSFIGGGQILGIPVPAIALLCGFIGLHIVMKFTAFGRSVYATGGNCEAARLSGIDVNRVRISSLAITGILAALSGIMLSSRIMSGTPDAVQNWELDIIAAVIIGGTSFVGGIGTIWGTLIGIVFIGVIVNGMTLLDVPIYTQYIVRAVLIFAAVLLNQVKTRQLSPN